MNLLRGSKVAAQFPFLRHSPALSFARYSLLPAAGPSGPRGQSSGIDGLGAMAFAQGFSAYLMLIVEYGFSLSSTREIARALHAPERISEVLAGVMGAKCVLGAVDSFADPNTSACSYRGQQANHE